MYKNTPHKALKQFINQCSDADMIWVLHVMNREIEERHTRTKINDRDEALIQLDIKTLNTLNNTTEIKNMVIDTYNHINEREVDDFTHSLKRLQSKLSIRARDLIKYKENKRLLYFALNRFFNNTRRYNNFTEIHNEYFRFLYMIFMFPRYYESNEFLDNLDADFSDILSKKSLHFKKADSDEFYQWAKLYMDREIKNDKVYDSQRYKPLTPEDYRIIVNSIFDSLLDGDALIYKAIKDQISNAWYQKSYRVRNKGREHYYFLTEKTLQCLEILTKKHNVTQEKMIEGLINERYAIECMDSLGNHLYRNS
jgi:hypothetical protein